MLREHTIAVWPSIFRLSHTHSSQRSRALSISTSLSMCNCSYLGSPCAAERALPARPRYGYAQVSQPCGGVAHVSTASPRDEVALSSRGVRSRAHPSSARCLGVPRAHPPRAAPARGLRGGGGSKLAAPRALPRLRSSRREALRRGGACCPGALAPPAVRRPYRAPAHFSLMFGSPAGNFVAE